MVNVHFFSAAPRTPQAQQKEEMMFSGRRAASGLAGAAWRRGWRADCPRQSVVACAATDAGATSAPSSAGAAAPAAQPPLQPFHLAFPVRDLEEARAFYGGVLGCQEGRSAATWVDYSLFGHQIVCHHVRGYNASATANAVDGDAVPVPHFGLALTRSQFMDLMERIRKAGLSFEIEPHLRFLGQPGEQYTAFFKDPSGNALEFKAMTHPENLFARYVVSE